MNAILLETPVERRRPVRLLALSSDTFPPWRVDVSVLFGEELACRGHTVDWLLQSEAECADPRNVRWGGGRVWVASADRGTTRLRRMLNHVLDIRNDLRLFALMASGRYDAILVKDKFVAGLLAILAARWFRKPFLYWLSFPLPEFYVARAREGTARYPLLYRLRGLACGVLLYRALLPAAEHVFLQSEQMRRDVTSQGIPPEKLSVVPMGISRAAVDAPQEGAVRRRVPPGEHCILYLGALGRERRIDFLLRVLLRVRREVPEAKLYLVGHAACVEDEHFLIEEARRMQLLEAVVFVGTLPHGAALEYVREADVCVSPYPPTPILNSTSPTKLVEYMAIGKPVVANSHPEQQLLLRESGCGYCVPYEEDAFAQAITALLRAPELARSLGERGRRYILEHRTYDRIADGVERQLLRITGPRETRARAPA